MQESTAFEPTIPEAARRYWLLVLATAVAGGLVGLLMALLLFNSSVATTTILITDPSGSAVFDTGTSARPERYLASQVAIIESPEMAESVAQLVPSGGLTARDVLESRTVISDPAIDLIRIDFENSDPENAINYANAYAAAYTQYRADITKETFDAAISGLDTSIAVIDEERALIDAEIEGVTTVPDGDDLVLELENAIRTFLGSPGNAATPEQVAELLNQLETLQVIRALETQNPTLTLLFETRRDIMDRRSQLVVRRDQLLADAALQSTGIVSISEATQALPAVSRARVVGITAILGAVAGVMVAYALAIRTRRFDDRSMPEVVLEAPMLAAIPQFSAGTDLPVRDDPLSPEAEAFRFAASALVARLGQLETGQDSEGSSVTVTSALSGEGKTVVAINAGLSLATRGKSVLIMDADFENPALTRLLLGDGKPVPGFTDITEGRASAVQDVVIPVNVGGGQPVHLLTKGTVDVSAADFFSSSITLELFSILSASYDYLLVDAPSLLQISYAASLARITDAAVVVIPHNGLVSQQQEVHRRLDTVGANLLGYVYNKTPRRSDAKERRGTRAYLMGRSKASVS